MIQFLKARDYEFWSLDQVLSLRDKPSPSRKFAVFTFDDGYIDNLTEAYPILKKHNIPFTIYVATNLPDGDAIIWWYLLEDLVVEKDTVEFKWKGENFIFNTDTVKNKEIAFNRIRQYLATADADTLKELIHQLFSTRKEFISERTKALALSWEQIKMLSDDPLVTIGAHTVNHLPLHSLTLENSRFEILESKRIIESHIGKEVKHFCYPIGSYGQKEIGILQESKYCSATTTKMANIFSENLEHPFALPRIMINSLSTEKILTLQLNGLLPALRNRLKRVVT
jgi:peptidoglycan/xylan/chitin deacetylase (PgdA/CDA1 family)